MVIVTPKNVQFQEVRFFIKASGEEKFLLFQRGEIKGVLHPRLVFELFLHFSQKLQHIGNK